jgi:hypothetical protein
MLMLIKGKGSEEEGLWLAGSAEHLQDTLTLTGGEGRENYKCTLQKDKLRCFPGSGAGGRVMEEGEVNETGSC